MKLDALTSEELECYEEWNTADHSGGDCQTQGYAWAAWDADRIIITEDEYGFVEASTYDADDGSGQRAYDRRVDKLQERDEKFEKEEEYSLCPICDEEKYLDDAFCNGYHCGNVKLDYSHSESGVCEECVTIATAKRAG
jgi:hypothetical protein